MSSKINDKAGRNLPAAIAVSLFLVGLLVFTLRYAHWGFVVLVAVFLSLGAYELHINLKRYQVNTEIGLVIFGIIFTQIFTYGATQNPGSIPWFEVFLAGLAFTVMAVLIYRMRKGNENYIKDTAGSIFIIGYLALMGAFIPMMLTAQYGPARIASMVLCVAANDTGGYVFGIFFGKHKMAPRLSPKKTWEGFVGSIICASIMGILLCYFFLDASPLVGLGLGLVCVFFGTAGDLVESTIKRDLKIKDMSSILPGHGGILDRLDAILMAAPAAWLWLHLLV